MELKGPDDKCLAILIKKDEYCNDDRSLNFFTQDEQFIQVGTWTLDNSRTGVPHKHNVFDRNSNITQEAVLCLQGSFKYSLFDENDNFIRDIKVCPRYINQ